MASEAAFNHIERGGGFGQVLSHPKAGGGVIISLK